MPNASIEQRADFSFIRYGTVWEDADILCSALGSGARGRRLLSVASAGGNALALLTLDPKEVLAVDLNPAQLACLELRLAAFQELDHAGLLGFLGVTAEAGRPAIYSRLRRRLSPAAQAFWDGQPEALALGAIHAGKLERFLRLYQWLLKNLVHGPGKISSMLEKKDGAGRLEFYGEVWNSSRWRALNRVAFSKRVMGMLGRDPEFFRHAGADVTSGPRARLENAMKRIGAHANPYLTYHLTGNYAAGALPKFLRPEFFKTIKARSHRVKLFLGKAEAAPGEFYGFNLSNIFEYMDPAQHEAGYHALLDKAQPGARLAYWNLHVERLCPASARKRARPLKALAAALHKKDQSWAYRSFQVDERLGA
jgi:S-adenosylmethionine-diacylglycerol 3-amino-3-carboxypropyl transferase